MEIMPWRPFGQLGLFRSDTDKLWDRFFNEKPLAKTLSEEWMPSVDISETEDKILIKAELPGLDTKDVNVSISGDILIIKGEKKKEEEEEIRRKEEEERGEFGVLINHFTLALLYSSSLHFVSLSLFPPSL